MKIYLCQCGACGQQTAWLSMNDAVRWGDSHLMPMLLGWMHASSFAERYRAVEVS